MFISRGAQNFWVFNTQILNPDEVLIFLGGIPPIPGFCCSLFGRFVHCLGDFNRFDPSLKETMYGKMVDPTHKLNVMTVDEQRKILAADRSNCKLDTAKLERWCPSVTPVNQAMQLAMIGLAEDVKRKKAAAA
eukprot:EG_transcript_27181